MQWKSQTPVGVVVGRWDGPRQNQDQSVFQCTDTGNIGKRSFLGQPGANFEKILREVLDRSVRSLEGSVEKYHNKGVKSVENRRLSNQKRYFRFFKFWRNKMVMNQK